MVKMPSLSPTMTAGTIVKWLKKEGDAVVAGDVLCEIQTDKAVVAFEMDDEGTLAKILMPENSTDVEVGTLIAVMAESGEDWKSVKVPSGAGKPAQAAAKSAPPKEEKGAKEAKPHAPTGGVLMGPAVRLLLDLYRVSAKDVSATGPKGALLKSDVMKYIDSKQLKPKPRTAEAPSAPAPAPGKKPSKPSAAPGAAPGTFTDLPLSNMRKTIAKRLTQSKTSVPHAYGNINVNVGAVLKLRKQLKADGIAVTINDFIIKAAASALKQVPEVNVQWDGNSENARYMHTIDVSVAVATESGLITPIVHNADQIGVVAISSKVKELADKAKANKLQLHEFQGGTFTVSNLGMFGITDFTAIINPPQAAILAIGGSQSVLDSELQPLERMTVTLCFDNRVIEEESAARWLEAFKLAFEEPSFILLGADSSLSLGSVASLLA